MTQLHKDNHYVPQLYLKQWSINGKIPTYRLLVPHEKIPLWKDHSLRGIAFHQHLYTYVVGQEETDELERWLDQEFEAPAEEAFRRAVNNERMSPENWKNLIRFAVAQDVRTPANLKKFLFRQVESLQELMDEVVENSVKKLEHAAVSGVKLPICQAGFSNKLPFKVSVNRTADDRSEVQTKIILGRKLWLWSVRHLLTETIEKVSYNRWTILHAPSGVLWPTTDNPVIKLNFYNTDKYNFDGGWGVPKCDIFFPLSPRHLLHCSVGRRSWPRGTILDQPTAVFIRKIIIEHADRYIFDKGKSDVHLIRPRIVNSNIYKKEQAAWKSWHQEQSEAERSLFR